MVHAFDILKPTLHDNDFLQSFVRNVDNESGETKRSSGTQHHQHSSKDADKDHSLTKIVGGLSKVGSKLDFHENGSSGRRSRNEEPRGNKRGGNELFARTPIKGSVEYELDAQKTAKGKRRQKNVTFRQEEVYTDKDRAAAVNMGSRDIIQSLKMKRRQDRNRELQIPDEAEPSAMLALAAREMRSGDVAIAIQCINKVLHANFLK